MGGADSGAFGGSGLGCVGFFFCMRWVRFWGQFWAQAHVAFHAQDMGSLSDAGVALW